MIHAKKSPGDFFDRPSQNFFQPTHKKEEVECGYGAGVESRSPQGFCFAFSRC